MQNIEIVEKQSIANTVLDKILSCLIKAMLFAFKFSFYLCMLFLQLIINVIQYCLDWAFESYFERWDYFIKRRQDKENELLKICLGYKAEDNEFLTWVIPYLLDLGLVVEAEAQDPRYINVYYLSEEGKDLLRNMKIVTQSISDEDPLEEAVENEASIPQNEKIYRLKDDFIEKRSKLKELFS